MGAEARSVKAAASADTRTLKRGLHDDLAALIHRDTGFQRSNLHYAGWLGVECPSVRCAVWMMRALVATNVLSRREGTTLFVPVNPATDPRGTIVSDAVERTYRCAAARGVR